MHGLVRIPDLDAGAKLDSRSLVMRACVIEMLDVFDVMGPNRKSTCTS